LGKKFSLLHPRDPKYSPNKRGFFLKKGFLIGKGFLATRGSPPLRPLFAKIPPKSAKKILERKNGKIKLEKKGKPSPWYHPSHR